MAVEIPVPLCHSLYHLSHKGKMKVTLNSVMPVSVYSSVCGCDELFYRCVVHCVLKEYKTKDERVKTKENKSDLLEVCGCGSLLDSVPRESSKTKREKSQDRTGVAGVEVRENRWTKNGIEKKRKKKKKKWREKGRVEGV